MEHGTAPSFGSGLVPLMDNLLDFRYKVRSLDNDVRSLPVRGSAAQHLFRFDNGYGASVVRRGGSYGGEYGKWELAVIMFDSGVEGNDAWELTYDTPVTSDVEGWLPWEGTDVDDDDDRTVLGLLAQIRDLPPRLPENPAAPPSDDPSDVYESLGNLVGLGDDPYFL